MGPGSKGKSDDGLWPLERWFALLATLAFAGLSFYFLIGVPVVTGALMWWRLGLGAGCSVIALVWYVMSPSYQGRMVREIIHDLEKPLTVHQVEVLQKSVGSAGFFNRIGLVGIPLAVALLACVLYVLVFVARQFNLQEASAFMDLAKLTTGAFIGAMTTADRSQ